MKSTHRSEGLIGLLCGNGVPVLGVLGFGLLLAGGFAVFIAGRGELLPHDTAFLGMTPQILCDVNECRVVHFMMHDRVSFGGALIAIGTMYLWLVVGPLSRGELWAWHLLAVSGAVGFLSFLAYLGYGYLDMWHGAATAALAPAFLIGLWLTRRRICWIDEGSWLSWRIWKDRIRDRFLLLATSAGMLGGGATILLVGMTRVFVPEDVVYLGVDRDRLNAINPRLIPLIAHDRAGFGGAICCCAIVLGGVALRAEPDRAGRQALAVAGLAGFGSAIGIHPIIGYTDAFHLAPAIVGATTFAFGLWQMSRE
jgi:hypothetical protein